MTDLYWVKPCAMGAGLAPQGLTCWNSGVSSCEPALPLSASSVPSACTRARLGAHHHVVDGYPAVVREVLQHGDQELQATVPVAQQEHHADEVHDAHHSAGQVVGHVEDLSAKGRDQVSNRKGGTPHPASGSVLHRHGRVPSSVQVRLWLEWKGIRPGPERSRLQAAGPQRDLCR